MDAHVNFSVSADVARRSGLANERYRTADGRFVMTDKDLQRVRLLPDEIVNGLDAIMLTKQEAEHLVSENGLKMGFADTEEDTEGGSVGESNATAGESGQDEGNTPNGEEE